MYRLKLSKLFDFGIKGKLSFFFLLSSILPFIFMGYYGYYKTAQSLKENISVKDKQDVASIISDLENFLKITPTNLKFLSNLYALEKYLQWRTLNEPYKTQQWLKDIRNTFYSFMAHKKIYLQLQLLDAQGYELLRINYDHVYDNITITPQNQLKSQRDSDYFNNAIHLKKSDIYLTTLHFNREQPVQADPLIRYATPVIDKNTVTQGVLVLSLRAESFLNLLREKNSAGQEHNYHYLLVNRLGEYLIHPDPRKEWGWQFETNTSLKQDRPELFGLISQQQRGSLLTEGSISTFQHFFALQDNTNYWVLIKQTRQETALAKLHNFTYLFAFTFVAILFSILLIMFWITKRLVNPLLLVNKHLKALAQGWVIEDEIEYHSSDEIGELVISTWQLKNSNKNIIAQVNAIAAGNYTTEVKLLSSRDQLGRALTHMTHTLREVIAKNAMQDWQKTGQTQLNDQMSGEQDVTTLTQNIIHFLTTCLQAQVGVFYLVDPNRTQPALKLIASYAYTRRKNLANEFQFGEGLVGQAALERQNILITQVPEDYIHVRSGLGESVPNYIIVMPFFYETILKGVIELGSFHEFNAVQQEFLDQVMPAIGIAVHSAQSRAQMQELLQQTQMQAEELRSQAEELQSQQDTLSQTNAELEERTQDLERQKNEIREKNLALEKNQIALELKAKELELASQYKSEFLANMSHELRTPLNSLLILAQLLLDNKQGNLTAKQLKYARTIYSAGSDLLMLINDILDLSKVEAGKMEINAEEISLPELIDTIEQKFGHIAEEKQLSFTITRAEALPNSFYTDSQRLQQIINNLLSNAFKFTHEGEIKLVFDLDNHPPLFTTSQPNKVVQPMIVIQVIDSGIGIPNHKQKDIFEAFQQVDGTTSRRFGGTGLGLSISRQLARLLGGDILLTSQESQGSTFSLYLPLKVKSTPPQQEEQPATQATVPVAEVLTPTATLHDDREQLMAESKFILIVEDDRKFCQLLMELAREKGFKVIVAEDGSQGLQLAERYKPDAIILDVNLPKVDGWTVMERLKENPQTRHIPVHFMSASDQSLEARKMGAIGYLLKPVNMEQLAKAFKKIEQFLANKVKNLLIIIDNQQRQQNILKLLDSEAVQPQLVADQTQAYQILQQENIDCIILDIESDGGRSIQLLEHLHHHETLSQIPVIIYAERELTVAEENLLQQCTDTLTVKAVQSPERLLDEAILFLHQVEAHLSQDKQQMLQMVHDKIAILANKKVLIVDDDIRNTFALATVLEDKEMEVFVAKQGQEALALLDKQPDIAIVLMDIMMPEMDGYEAMRQIRAQSQFRNLPIIALTAKAMKGDKTKCIEAGANDYLAKPVDTDKLISLMRVWLYR